ncbi:hypothetical protein QKT26_gp90 [Carcinus maenas nudivirus]|uniref:Uncharacterized protein n=1 Tax=Carcinus maenas nudivirus TaxID=2880837 RepID=A0AAE9C013_9VIRU|nr:hypothetical protein QKT26_gp90 [Carcinus maenas nudivirus]UBZ25680.1 hypothetical protein CmNV_089 [Carcinus maenas nudivirus]
MIIVVTNVDLRKQIVNNSKIDFVNIQPHFILFGVKLSYMIDNKVIKVKPQENNTVKITNLKHDITKLFEHLVKNVNLVTFIHFDSTQLCVPDMSQILENISKFITKK